MVYMYQVSMYFRPYRWDTSCCRICLSAFLCNQLHAASSSITMFYCTGSTTGPPTNAMKSQVTCAPSTALSFFLDKEVLLRRLFFRINLCATNNFPKTWLCTTVLSKKWEFRKLKSQNLERSALFNSVLAIMLPSEQSRVLRTKQSKAREVRHLLCVSVWSRVGHHVHTLWYTKYIIYTPVQQQRQESSAASSNNSKDNRSSRSSSSARSARGARTTTALSSCCGVDTLQQRVTAYLYVECSCRDTRPIGFLSVCTWIFSHCTPVCCTA